MLLKRSGFKIWKFCTNDHNEFIEFIKGGTPRTTYIGMFN